MNKIKSILIIVLISGLLFILTGCTGQLAFRPNDQATKEELIKKIKHMQPQSAGEVKFVEVIHSMDNVHAGEYSFIDDLFEYTAIKDNQFITKIFRKGSPEKSPSVVRSQLEMDQLAIKLFMTNFASLPLKTVTGRSFATILAFIWLKSLKYLTRKRNLG